MKKTDKTKAGSGQGGSKGGKKQDWAQPLLTKHEQLRTLTGKSGEKDPVENDDGDPKDKHNHGKGHAYGHDK